MSRPSRPAHRTVLTACALAAAVNLAAVMLTPRTDAPAPVATESQPAASVRAQPAPVPPSPSVRTQDLAPDGARIHAAIEQAGSLARLTLSDTADTHGATFSVTLPVTADM